MTDSGKYQSVKDIGVVEEQNHKFRRTMEDAHLVCDSFGNDPNQGFFAIYDGHGGRGAVEFTVKNLHNILIEELQKNVSCPDALKEAFLRTDAKIGENKIDTSGSTAVTALLRRKERKLYIANCGDARAVLGIAGKAMRLSHDHKGTDEAEVKRITDLGGFVVLNRVNGILAVTRALGDHNMKEYVTAEPFTTETDLPEDTESSNTFLILACDGLWDVISDQEAIDLIMENPNVPAQKMSEVLLHFALKNGSTDNISIMVLKL